MQLPSGKNTDRINLGVIVVKSSWPPAADPDRHLVSFSVNYNTPYINTSLVKPENEPRTFTDLLSPLLKGKIAISEPATDPMLPRMYIAASKYGFLKDDFFRALAGQGLKAAGTVRDADGFVLRGEAAVRFPGSYSSFAPFIKEGAPTKPLNPTEGTVAVISTPIARLKWKVR